ncbi:AraC family transcriptional regulator [Alloalcanivorax gelatiniphagus]|uniref:AraC family transcriptional regulator n=1 Tax=Alloalcanivorax gelatiniphagus TaxID=1194167 RepID=A0ABY2XMZ0_9GAMM|nr:AraC family transcriptional regulator [Alloalcanivorax gelatiniphagus]TMW13063.1 AraC family transcriptional regulator [Alloalcanivorax gelatiniphagus]|tara:strand:+ start:12238 stop:13275 length:1038 start_codon:yes stop_codon:yes gene_type:complete
MDPLGFISVAALRQYLASASAREVDVDQALAASGLGAEELTDPEARIRGARFERLLNELILRSGDPLFGLHTCELVQPGSYNVMGYIAMSAATIGEALSKVSRYEKLVGDMGTTETRLHGDRSEILWHCRYPRQPARRHLIDNVLGSWLHYTRWLTGDLHLAPDEVWFEHPRPHYLHEVHEYERVFGCPVRFRQPYSALIGHPRMLDYPLRQPDATLLSTLEAHAARQLRALGIATSLGERVRQYLQEALGGPLPDRDQVARAMRLNTRTLHRRLAAEGTGWQRILDEVRMERACQRLRDGHCSQSDIALDLGYADIRCFQRSFKRHTGVTPGEWRRRAEADALL